MILFLPQGEFQYGRVVADDRLLAREPQQERSRRTLERLVEAAQSLIAERELEDISVPAICARAGVSTGAFYGRFDSKDAFIEYVFQRRLKDRGAELAREFADPRWEQATATELIAAFIQELIKGVRRNPPLMRALDTRGRTRTVRPELREAGAESFRHLSTMVARLLAAKTGQRPAELERRVMFLFELTVAVATNRIAYEGRTFVDPVYRVSDQALLAELTRIGRAYLLPAEPHDAPFGRPVRSERDG
jgi:AcrR family transcriptional regulator